MQRVDLDSIPFTSYMAEASINGSADIFSNSVAGPLMERYSMPELKNSDFQNDSDDKRNLTFFTQQNIEIVDKLYDEEIFNITIFPSQMVTILPLDQFLFFSVSLPQFSF